MIGVKVVVTVVLICHDAGKPVVDTAQLLQ